MSLIAREVIRLWTVFTNRHTSQQAPSLSVGMTTFGTEHSVDFSFTRVYQVSSKTVSDRAF